MFLWVFPVWDCVEDVKYCEFGARYACLRQFRVWPLWVELCMCDCVSMGSLRCRYVLAGCDQERLSVCLSVWCARVYTYMCMYASECVGIR